MPLMCIKASDVKRLKGGTSRLMAAVMEIFWGSHTLCSFRDGLRMPSATGSTFFLRARFSALVADEKALKESYDLKGASGLKCCCLCANILRCKPDDVPPRFFHVANGRHCDFHKVSENEWRELVDTLSAAARQVQEGNARPADLQELERVLGLNFNELSMSFHPLCRQLGNPVRNVVFDAMHVILGSGGCSQYELNSFMLRLQAETLGTRRLTPDVLDQFAATVAWPSSGRGSPRSVQRVFT